MLVILAALSGRGMSIQELLEGSVQENNAYCRQYDPSFAGFNSVWADALPEDVPTFGQISLRHGRQMVDRDLGPWGFTVGVVLAFVVYCRGLGFASFLLKIPPWRWVRNWLYERMYFDELYFGVFVSTVSLLSEAIGWLDEVVMDGMVNGAAGTVRKLAVLAGAVDDRWVDGAVTGAASLAGQVGEVARAPQTGRIRGYVTVMVAAAALVVAVAVIVALSR